MQVITEQDITNFIDNIPFESLFGVAGIIIGASLFALALVVFTIVCTWRIYVKMGAPGWAAIVPYYTNWVLCEKVWGNALVSLALIIPGVLPYIIDSAVLSLIGSLVSIVVGFITNWKMYKCFGKSTGFCLLSIFFSPITLAICAFDQSQFIGPINNMSGVDTNDSSF